MTSTLRRAKTKYLKKKALLTNQFSELLHGNAIDKEFAGSKTNYEVLKDFCSAGVFF